jgi:hypothetical protein
MATPRCSLAICLALATVSVVDAGSAQVSVVVELVGPPAETTIPLHLVIERPGSAARGGQHRDPSRAARSASVSLGPLIDGMEIRGGLTDTDATVDRPACRWN